MSDALHQIDAHDHELKRVDRRESEWGVTVKYECVSCDYWRSEFKNDQQATLGGFS